MDSGVGAAKTTIKRLSTAHPCMSQIVIRDGVRLQMTAALLYHSIKTNLLHIYNCRLSTCLAKLVQVLLVNKRIQAGQSAAKPKQF